MSGGGMTVRGPVAAVLGDNIDTDMIYPGRYLNITDREKTAEHLFELAYPDLRDSLRGGGILVAGHNFGCGSSREQAAAALKFAGAAAIVAVSFARIFYRNAINLGLPAIVLEDVAWRPAPGDDLEIDLAGGEIRDCTAARGVRAAPLDARAVELLAAGGLVPYLKSKYLKRGAHGQTQDRVAAR